MAVPKVGSLWTKKDPIREAGELQCKIPDSDDTKEIQPFCPDALKGRRLSYNRCHRRRAHIHSMSRDLADKIIHPPKKAPTFKNKSILSIRKKDGDDESRGPQYLRRGN